MRWNTASRIFLKKFSHQEKESCQNYRHYEEKSYCTKKGSQHDVDS